MGRVDMEGAMGRNGHGECVTFFRSTGADQLSGLQAFFIFIFTTNYECVAGVDL